MELVRKINVKSSEKSNSITTSLNSSQKYIIDVVILILENWHTQMSEA